MARVVRPGGRVLMNVFGDPHRIEFFEFFVRAIQTVRPGFEGPPMDPPPLPFQLQDPERLRRELTIAGLKKVSVETTTETMQFHTGKELWDWLISSNPVAEILLAELDLTSDERGAIRDALHPLVRERSEGNGPAVLTSPINIGIGTR
jgi:hypothetical protein